MIHKKAKNQDKQQRKYTKYTSNPIALDKSNESAPVPGLEDEKEKIEDYFEDVGGSHIGAEDYDVNDSIINDETQYDMRTATEDITEISSTETTEMATEIMDENTPVVVSKNTPKVANEKTPEEVNENTPKEVNENISDPFYEDTPDTFYEDAPVPFYEDNFEMVDGGIPEVIPAISNQLSDMQEEVDEHKGLFTSSFYNENTTKYDHNTLNKANESFLKSLENSALPKLSPMAIKARKASDEIDQNTKNYSQNDINRVNFKSLSMYLFKLQKLFGSTLFAQSLSASQIYVDKYFPSNVVTIGEVTRILKESMTKKEQTTYTEILDSSQSNISAYTKINVSTEKNMFGDPVNKETPAYIALNDLSHDPINTDSPFMSIILVGKQLIANRFSRITKPKELTPLRKKVVYLPSILYSSSHAPFPFKSPNMDQQLNNKLASSCKYVLNLSASPEDVYLTICGDVMFIVNHNCPLRMSEFTPLSTGLVDTCAKLERGGTPLKRMNLVYRLQNIDFPTYFACHLIAYQRTFLTSYNEEIIAIEAGDSLITGAIVYPYHLSAGYTLGYATFIREALIPITKTALIATKRNSFKAAGMHIPDVDQIAQEVKTAIMNREKAHGIPQRKGPDYTIAFNNAIRAKTTPNK